MGETLRRLAIAALQACTLILLYELWVQNWPEVLPWSGRAALSRYLSYLAVAAGIVVVLSKSTRLHPLATVTDLEFAVQRHGVWINQFLKE